MIEPRYIGELGHREWAIGLIEMGVCSCDECGGHLIDRRCLSCGCVHGIQEPTQHLRERYATWGLGEHCQVADAYRAAVAAEQARVEAQQRRRD